MKELIRCELKKLLSRRMVWAALALGIVFLVSGSEYLIRYRLGGRVQGIQDVYARYEGQVLTDAVVKQAETELAAYIAQHPDEFNAYYDEEREGMFYSSRGFYDYSTGLEEAYDRIIMGQTLEDEEERRAYMAQRLETGRNEDGTPLTEETRKYYASSLAEEIEPEIITYMEGYAHYFSYGQTSGILVLALLAVLLSPLFPAERTSRMEPVVLATAKRRKGAMAKIAASLIFGLGLYILFYGLNVLIVGLSYGFTGFHALPNTLDAPWDGGSAGRILLVYLGISLMASLAWALLMAWISSAFRHSLPALLAGGVAAAVQIIPPAVAHNSIYIPALVSFWKSGAGHVIQQVVSLLPASSLSDHHSLLYYSEKSGTLAWGLGLSAAILTLSLVFTSRCWLSQRKV